MKSKMLTAFLMVFLLLISLAGCFKTESIKATVPEYIAKLASLNTAVISNDINSKGGIKANLYFDNTQSMYGYVSAGKKSNFVVTNNALYDILSNYDNATFNKLSPDKSDSLKWTKLAASKTFKDYMNKKFYTYKGFLNKGEGPLQLLFNQKSAVDFNDLNVFITDLAEQNLENKLLARWLNDEAQKRDNCSIALFCIQSYFTGKATIPLTGVVDKKNATIEMATQDFDGIRPFYVIMIGPTDELQNLANSLSASLKDDANSDQKFNYSIFYSHNGLQRVDWKNIQLIPLHDDTNFTGYSEELSNECFNFREVEPEAIFSDVDTALPCFNLVYDTKNTPKNGDDRNHGCINVIVPCRDLFGDTVADKTSYSVDSERVSVQHYKALDSKSETNNESSALDFSEKIKYTWEPIKEYDYKKVMSIDNPVFYNKGAAILRYNNKITDEIKNSLEDSDKEPIYTVKSNSGALQIKISIKDVEKIKQSYGNFFTIMVPIVANRDLVNNIPNWVDEYNLSDSETYNVENPKKSLNFFTMTDGLKEFYNVLIGNYSSYNEEQQYKINMQKTIAEIAVNVCLEDPEN